MNNINVKCNINEYYILVFLRDYNMSALHKDENSEILNLIKCYKLIKL